jgi:AcrR family transcriptional regulator
MYGEPMHEAVDPTTSPRAPLSRERVLRAAMALADEYGIEAVTMRRLAQELRVEAMSLYHHVKSKDDIVDGIVDLALGEIDLPDGEPVDWKASLRHAVMSAHDVFVRHRWAPTLMNATQTIPPARLRLMEFLLGTLRRAGFSPGMTDHAYHALDSHITGYSLWLASLSLGTDENMEVMASAFLRTLPPEYPYMAEHVKQHLQALRGETEDQVGEFEFGLGLILDGLERILAPS